MNHASVSIGDFIYSFGGYCSGEDYRLSRPMDVHVLNTETMRWHQLTTKEKKYPNVPFQRYGESNCHKARHGIERCSIISNLLVALSPRRININFCVIRADRKADEKLSVSFRFSLPFTFSPNRTAINFRTYGLCIRKQSVHFRRPQRRDGESRVMQFCSASNLSRKTSPGL